MTPSTSFVVVVPVGVRLFHSGMLTGMIAVHLVQIVLTLIAMAFSFYHKH